MTANVFSGLASKPQTIVFSKVDYTNIYDEFGNIDHAIS